MIVPCEVAVKSVIPAVKALLAKELAEKHGLKQDQVAAMLGISQSAVSKYTRKVRGYVVKIDIIEEMQPLMDEVVGLLVDGNCGRAEFLKFFCKTCAMVRKSSLMCELCGKTDPTIEVEECGFCMK